MAENQARKAEQVSDAEAEISREELQRRMEEARVSITQSVNEIKESVVAHYSEVAVGNAGTAAQLDESDEEEELKALINESLAVVERARERMGREQAEIDRLKTETRMMISKLLAA